MIRKDLSATPRAFLDAKPFPHLIVDGLFEDEVAQELARTFPPVDDPRYKTSWHLHSKKASIQKPRLMPPLLLEALQALRSPGWLAWLEEVTGKRRLLVDHHWFGEGVHTAGPGGFLDIHADFTVHPNGWQRALNALIYLSPDWEPAWGGSLELWPLDLVRANRTIIPLVQNRMVLFETSATSFHGFPMPLRCPDGRQRNVLQLYYYQAIPLIPPVLRTTLYPLKAQSFPKRLRRRVAGWVKQVAPRRLVPS